MQRHNKRGHQQHRYYRHHPVIYSDLICRCAFRESSQSYTQQYPGDELQRLTGQKCNVNQQQQHSTLAQYRSHYSSVAVTAVGEGWLHTGLGSGLITVNLICKAALLTINCLHSLTRITE